MWVWSLGWEDPLEKGMAAHSSILAWRIPYTWPYSPPGHEESDTTEVTKHARRNMRLLFPASSSFQDVDKNARSGLAAWRHYGSSEVVPSLDTSPGRHTRSHSYKEMYFCLHNIVVQSLWRQDTRLIAEYWHSNKTWLLISWPTHLPTGKLNA